MAEPLPIPAPLKIPEISRFINRANQLRAFKPAIAYWCEYHAVNQIVGKGLHNTDDDCFAFTKALLERLEATKAERPDDDAIMDNTAGQAYVEQFAQETFDRAERTMRANKVTRQTADTFDAAATFFDLTHEWGTPEPDVLQKIKFAKWNAARILKAIREGKDPNESNPKPREEEDQEPALDPLDPAVQQLTNPPPAASVEEVPDGGEPSSSRPEQPVSEGYFPPPPPPPPQPADFDSNEPFVPSPMSTSPPPPVDSQPPPPPPPAQLPSQFTSFAPPPQPPEPVNPSIPPSWTAPTVTVPPAVASPTPLSAPVSAAVPAPSAPAVTSLGGGSGAPSVADQKSIAQAQKHAKWAISALNFDDVPTAVQELRNALATLGAL